MCLPLAQLICGMPPQIIPSHAPSFNQHITDGTLLLALLQPTTQSKTDATTHQPTPGSQGLLTNTDHPLVYGRTSSQTDITTHCPSTAK